MPRIVDHHERREQITQLARALLLKEGLGALTVRNIAKQLGFSTAVVSHYFTSKQDLMLLIYLDAHGRAEKRFLQAQKDYSDPAKVLSVFLPIEATSQQNWQIWFALWSMTALDETFRHQQALQARRLLKQITATLGAHPAMAGQRDKMTIARNVFALMSGIATQAMLDPDSWSPQRQRKQLRQGIERLIGP